MIHQLIKKILSVFILVAALPGSTSSFLECPQFDKTMPNTEFLTALEKGEENLFSRSFKLKDNFAWVSKGVLEKIKTWSASPTLVDTRAGKEAIACYYLGPAKKYGDFEAWERPGSSQYEREYYLFTEKYGFVLNISRSKTTWEKFKEKVSDLKMKLFTE